MTQLDSPQLRLLAPAFTSPLLDVLTELEHLRRLELRGTTPPPVFFQLKRVFHLLESLASARIEGNHTTLAEYVEQKVAGKGDTQDAILEIANLEAAMDYIDRTLEAGSPIPLQFIRELHQMAVRNLVREGDPTPGAWRTTPVAISGSAHRPPEPVDVPASMQELADFLNRDDPRKYDLMKVALVHHRLAWIHPFRNGNGRVVRLLTYALLIKYGFQVSAAGRLLNPAAVFCNDRPKYYAMLAVADQGSDSALEEWCLYVLQGVLDEIRKLDRLADYGQLSTLILKPAIAHCRERQLITAQEERILTLAIDRRIVKSGDLSAAMPNQNAPQRTYQIRKLVDRGMLLPVHEGARQYVIGFAGSALMRGVVRALTASGLVPHSISEP